MIPWYVILSTYLHHFSVLDPRISYQGLLANCGDDISLKSALQLVIESNTCLKHQLWHHSLWQHRNHPRVHPKRLTSQHAISSNLAWTSMSWRSSGSYHRRTSKIVILFNDGLAKEHNSPVCHGMLEISSLFLVGFSLHSVMLVAESM